MYTSRQVFFPTEDSDVSFFLAADVYYIVQDLFVYLVSISTVGTFSLGVTDYFLLVLIASDTSSKPCFLPIKTTPLTTKATTPKTKTTQIKHPTKTATPTSKGTSKATRRKCR